MITKHLDGKRLVTMFELLSIKLVDGPPGSAPKLTIDTDYISRASRALAAMTLVKRASASEIAVKSEAIQETWINGHGMDWWITASWIRVGIVTCCIMIRLVLLRRKSVRFTERDADFGRGQE